MRITLSLVLICLVTSFSFSQSKSKSIDSKDKLSSFVIDTNKPDVYITFEKQSAFISYKNETYKVIWLRLHNNLKGSISFYTYDNSISHTDKNGINYEIEKIPRYYKSESLDNSEMPIGYPPSDSPSISELKSGESYFFGIPDFHLIDDTRIVIQIFYPWEVGNEFDSIIRPLHFVYFYKSLVPEKDKLEEKVMEASLLLPVDFKAGVKKFNQIGEDSIPYIVNILFDETKQTKLVKFIISPLLVDILYEFKSSLADKALIKLLGHKHNRLKGRAIGLLGMRKTKKAIPHLVSFLNDEAVYLTISSSQSPDKYILFRDEAVKTLENITGKKLLPNADGKSKADAWLSWFQTNKNDLN